MSRLFPEAAFDPGTGGRDSGERGYRRLLPCFHPDQPNCIEDVTDKE
jgi:hypothetical protein